MRSSRWVAALAVGIVVTLWMVPPYAVIDDASGGARHAAIGHWAVWSPPTRAQADPLLQRAVGPGDPGEPTRPRVIRNQVHLTFETLLVLLVAVVAWRVTRWRAKRGRDLLEHNGRGALGILLVLLGPGCQEPADSALDGEPPYEVALVPELQLSTALGYVSAVRGLPDGVVLAADPTAPALLRIDLEAGTVDTLGREGDGPGEYRQPDRVYPLPGDSTLLVDIGRSRMVAVGPDGAIGDGASLVSRGSGRYPFVIHPRFVDEHGRVYYQANVDREGRAPDSAAVVRFDRGTQEHDTVARLWMPEFTRERGDRPVQVILQASDEWAVGADGRVAVVRVDPYAVEWHHPDGTARFGPAVPVDPYPVTAEVQESTLEAMANEAIVTRMVVGDGGVQSFQQQRGIPASMERPTADAYAWAETLPVVRSEGVTVMPWGDVWVERMVPPGRPVPVQIFSAEGTPRGDFRLPPGRRLIGVEVLEDGPRAYLVRTDEVGLRWLERYRIQGGDSR